MVDTSKTQSGPTHIVESHHAVEIRITQAIESSKHGVSHQISLLQQGNFVTSTASSRQMEWPSIEDSGDTRKSHPSTGWSSGNELMDTDVENIEHVTWLIVVLSGQYEVLYTCSLRYAHGALLRWAHQRRAAPVRHSPAR